MVRTIADRPRHDPASDPAEFFLSSANIQAKLAADLVSALAFGTNIEKGEKVLPVSLGLSVNFPFINCEALDLVWTQPADVLTRFVLLSATCKGLPFVQTRMSESRAILIVGFSTNIATLFAAGNALTDKIRFVNGFPVRLLSVAHLILSRC